MGKSHAYEVGGHFLVFEVGGILWDPGPSREERLGESNFLLRDYKGALEKVKEELAFEIEDL